MHVTAAGGRRISKDGGYAKGEETRARIIEAALMVFGRDGYDGATTREIARLAGQNAPALQYYFDGKAGLHMACAEYIIDHSWSLLRPAVSAAMDCDLSTINDEDMHNLLGAITDALFDCILGPTTVGKWAQFMSRSASDGDRASYALIQDRLIAPTHAACRRLVGALIGKPADDPETALRVLTIIGQIAIFNNGRMAALAATGWPDFNDGRLDFLKRLVRQQVCAGLRLSERPPQVGCGYRHPRFEPA